MQKSGGEYAGQTPQKKIVLKTLGAGIRLNNVSVGHATRFTGIIELGTRVLLLLCDMVVKPLGLGSYFLSALAGVVVYE